MAHSTEVKFGEFKMDERYKKLERTLKLASLKNGSGKDLGGSSLWAVPSPSISSITADAFDSSVAAHSHTSRRESEVVSSSNNLRKILPKKKESNIGRKAVATSSVKRFNMKASDYEDCLIMPPPSFHYSSKKQNAMSVSNTGKFIANVQTAYSSNMDDEPCQNTGIQQSNNNINTEYQEKNVTSHMVSNNFQNRQVRIFSNWRIMLNGEGQLIIKGTLECGKIARSKPVIRRLTATRVESIFKHEYNLRGTIVDDRNELPDYVRGKFYNGFPDDWDNVYQIWRSFVQQGCAVTFRWPTPITDSDDDLRSEITDITFSCSKNAASKSKFHCFKEPTINECSAEVSKQEKSHVSHHSSRQNDSFTQTYISGTTGDLFYNVDENSMDKENSAQNVNRAFTPRTNKLKDILKEDKLQMIINNLSDKNCSQEYIDKIIEMFDCLNYVVSYRYTENLSQVEVEEPTGKDTNISSRKSNDTLESMSSKNISHTNKQENTFNVKKITDSSNATAHVNKENENDCDVSQGQRNCSQIEKRDSDSESETYTGIPKISMERILRQREVFKKPCKLKVKKKMINDQKKYETEIRAWNTPVVHPSINQLKRNVDLNRNDSSVSITEDEIDFSPDRNILFLQDNSNRPARVNLNPNESCVSITEDERDFSAGKKTLYLQDNSKRPVDMIETRQRIISDSTDRQELKEISPYKNAGVTSKPTVISSISTNLNLKFVNKKLNFLRDVGSECIRKDEKELDEVHDKGSLKMDNQKDSGQDAKVGEVVVSTTMPVQAVSKNDIKIDCKAKSLTAWTPRVIYHAESDFDAALIFEGNLLNEAGHVVHRRFLTDIIQRRVSSRLIETVNNEFYQLVGDINDTKHVVPKELLSQCRYGCPSRMEKFCRAWMSLQSVEPIEKLGDVSIDTVNVAVSSKGRRILPPLSYWTGERIILKDNNAVYSPGTLQNTVSSESPSKSSKTRDATKQGTNLNRKSNEPDASAVSQNRTTSSSGKSNNVEISNERKKANSKHKMSTTKHKSRKAQSDDDSSDDQNSPVHKRQRLKTNQQDPLNSAQVLQRMNTRSLNTEITGEFAKTRSKKSTNAEYAASPVKPLKPMMMYHNSSTERYNDLICTYYRDIPLKGDTILSDDQVSHV